MTNPYSPPPADRNQNRSRRFTCPVCDCRVNPARKLSLIYRCRNCRTRLCSRPDNLFAGIAILFSLAVNGLFYLYIRQDPLRLLETEFFLVQLPINIMLWTPWLAIIIAGFPTPVIDWRFRWLTSDQINALRSQLAATNSHGETVKDSASEQSI